jgi:hypothetical protein
MLRRVSIGLPFIVLLLASPSVVGAQTKPTQAEINEWKKEAGMLESSGCKKITWLLESEQAVSTGSPRQQPIHYALGWWGRGFIEGAVYIISDKAQKRASEFGLSVDVVAAHIATYCYDHQTETPFDAVQQLLLKVLK